MAGKLTAFVILFSVIAVVTVTEAKPEPEPAAKPFVPVLIAGAVIANTCSESYCFHNNWEKRDRLAEACGGSRRSSYRHPIDGVCYCYQEC
jgi:hypothetical protein